MWSTDRLAGEGSSPWKRCAVSWLSVETWILPLDSHLGNHEQIHIPEGGLWAPRPGGPGGASVFCPPWWPWASLYPQWPSVFSAVWREGSAASRAPVLALGPHRGHQWCFRATWDLEATPQFVERFFTEPSYRALLSCLGTQAPSPAQPRGHEEAQRQCWIEGWRRRQQPWATAARAGGSGSAEKTHLWCFLPKIAPGSRRVLFTLEGVAGSPSPSRGSRM